MARIAYVDGKYLPSHLATVAMEDRGYQFADGVYEVSAFINNRLLDEAKHLDRLERSLEKLEPCGSGNPAVRLSNRSYGLIYLQITRGTAPRNHLWKADIKPVLTMCVLPAKFPSAAMREQGIAVVTALDERWARCDIKSISLLPNILARKKSDKPGLRETWLVNDKGIVTEGASTNAFIIDKNGKVITHPADNRILGGVTRDVLLQLAREHQITIEERGFTETELASASEAFITSTSNFVMPVTKIDDKPVGNGKVGAITKRLMEIYDSHLDNEVGPRCAA